MGVPGPTLHNRSFSSFVSIASSLRLSAHARTGLLARTLCPRGVVVNGGGRRGQQKFGGAKGEDPVSAGSDGEVGCLAAVGCFGNGIVAGLAHFSYKSNNFCAERQQPPLLLDEPPLTIAVDHATNDWAGAPDGMGTRAVPVAVRDCDYHGETVAEGESRGQWGRVSVPPGKSPALPSRASGRWRHIAPALDSCRCRNHGDGAGRRGRFSVSGRHHGHSGRAGFAAIGPSSRRMRSGPNPWCR